MGPNPGAPIAMLQNITIYYVFATLAPQKHAKRSILAILDPTMAALPQFGVRSGPSKKHLKPLDARKDYHEPTMSNTTPFQVTRSPEL